MTDIGVLASLRGHNCSIPVLRGSIAMSDENTAELEAENQAVTEDTTNDESQTVEAAEDSSSESGDDVKEKGESYYEEQLKRIQDEKDKLEAEAKERERQIELKDRAIEAQKKKLKSAQTGNIDVSSLKAEILSDMKLEATIEANAANEAEAKLIKHHLEHSIVRTGDQKLDVLNAKALANAARLNDILARGSVEEEADERSISSMSGGHVRGTQGSGPKSAVRREAEKLLPKEMRKYLDPHVPN